ncbi:MAG: hypothetical protein A3K59_01695 [Euryarchaeota archaeon RBG_19FT_COMBO_69_17]|nr:MAG: hypothetical protein A3K59_01695 [Euryarchaeota archaeon RBG_19FT_COMBO_69_17]
MTPFGGTSSDLALSQVGINREALESNTSLDPLLDRVRVAFVGRARIRPLLMDRFFEVVPLDEHRPDAFARSPGGEVVLAEGDAVLRGYGLPRTGEDVLINNVFGARLNATASPVEFERILRELLAEGARDRGENT